MQAVGARVAGAVQAAVDRARLLADALHHVDLAAGRPPAGEDVVAEEPERRPHPLALRDLDAGLEVAVGLGHLTGGDEPGRRVVTRSVPALGAGALLSGGDGEVARAVEGGVGGAGGVGLQLLVAPPGATGLGAPRRADRAAGGSGELVGPGEGPQRGGSEGAHRESGGQRDDEQQRHAKSKSSFGHASRVGNRCPVLRRIHHVRRNGASLPNCFADVSPRMGRG